MSKLSIGIMSGTSLDGIDIALTRLTGYDEDTKVEFIKGKTFEWPIDTLAKIKEVLSLETSNVANITSLNYELGYVYGELVNKFLKENGLTHEDISFIASHGQTIWHEPNEAINGFKSTLQLGEGAVISEVTKCDVVSNFRARDIAAGGEGAPLVPFVDKILFGHQEKKLIAVHNLGGISNTSLILQDKVVAFDTGPANMMIDYAINKLFNLKYDKNGIVAQKGIIIKEMYEEVMSLDYFKLGPPKSTGRELFGDKYTKYLINKYHYSYKKEDIITTLSYVTIDSIVHSYQQLISNYGLIDEIIFSGGGSHNNFIIDMISKKLPNINISKSDKYGIDVDFKEAIAFSILGNQTMNKRPSNLPSATGAKNNVILGQINYYK